MTGHLVLYAKQLAWLQSTPKPENQGKNVSILNKDTKTRAESIQANGGVPLLPEVGLARYLVDYFNNAGRSIGGGATPAPLTSTELSAWAAGSGVRLSPWEFQALLDMSRAYVVQSFRSDSIECPPPYGDGGATSNRQGIASKVGAILGRKLKG